LNICASYKTVWPYLSPLLLGSTSDIDPSKWTKNGFWYWGFDGLSPYLHCVCDPAPPVAPIQPCWVPFLLLGRGSGSQPACGKAVLRSPWWPCGGCPGSWCWGGVCPTPRGAVREDHIGRQFWFGHGSKGEVDEIGADLSFHKTWWELELAKSLGKKSHPCELSPEI